MFVLIALVVASCSARDAEPSTSQDSAVPSSAPPDSSSAPSDSSSAPSDSSSSSAEELIFEPADNPVASSVALVSIVTAHDVDAAGDPVRRSGNFAPAAAQVTTVIEVGELATAAELLVRWFHADGASDEALFEHRIDVRSGASAYSTGVSRGLLALGRYEVVASLGDDSLAVPFMVTEQRGDAEGFRRSTSPAPPGTDGQTAEPPTSGPSGAVDDNSPGAAGSGCRLSAVPHGLVSAFVDVTGCGVDSTTVAAGVAGSPLKVIETVAGDFARPYGADPCRVGGSDLPYSTLTIAARKDAGEHSSLFASAELRLGPDEADPTVTIESTPPSRTQVFPGDAILLVIRVDDGIDPGLGQTGVRDIEVTEADGTVLGGQSYGLEPVPCDKSRLHQEIAVTATVPEEGDTYWIDVGASDFAGKVTKVSLAWYTKSTWQGTMEAEAHATSTAGEPPPNVCDAHWQLLITIPVEGRGDISGQAHAQAIRPPRCVPWGFGGAGATELEMTVTGTFDGDAFQLQIHTPVPAGQFDVALFMLYYPAPRTFTVPVKGWYASSSHAWTYEDGPGEFTASLDAEVFLSCDECKIGG